MFLTFFVFMKDKKDKREKRIRKSPIFNVLMTEWKYLGRRKGTFVLYISMFVIAGIISLATPLLIGTIFNSIQQNIESQQELRRLLFMISLLLVIQIGFWLFHGTGRILEGRTGFYVNRNYINSKIKKVLDLPIKWHKDHHSGDTIDKINRGAAAISGFSEYTTFQIVYGVVGLVGAITILFFFDLIAAGLALVFSIGVLFMIFMFDKKLSKQYRELNTYGNKVSVSIFDYVSNIITVVTLRLKKSVKKEIDSRLMASHELFRKNRIITEFKWGLASTAIALMTVLVLSIKAYTDYNTTGIILVGTLYILYGYLRIVGQTFYDFAEIYGRIVAYDASIVSAYPIDDAYEKVGVESKGRLPPEWRNISIEEASFTYDKNGKITHLDNINMKFRKGQRIALVGESGSGKSTVLALLRGLNNPDSGKVKVDGKETKFGFEKMKAHITLIPQDPEIFNNTIGYNISMGLSAKKEDVNKAIKLAQFTTVVDRLEKGLKANVLEKGVSLSSGEKQRLALARGILAGKNSDIILMDEPTSSVDTINEIKIYENIFREFKGKTIISSIHRLHLLKNFDYIYLFDKGKIVAEGNFESLKRNALFRKMWKKYRHLK